MQKKCLSEGTEDEGEVLPCTQSYARNQIYRSILYCTRAAMKVYKKQKKTTTYKTIQLCVRSRGFLVFRYIVLWNRLNQRGEHHVIGKEMADAMVCSRKPTYWNVSRCPSSSSPMRGLFFFVTWNLRYCYKSCPGISHNSFLRSSRGLNTGMVQERRRNIQSIHRS